MKFEYKPLILKEKNETSKQQKQVGDDRKTSAKVAEVRPGQEKYKNLV